MGRKSKERREQVAARAEPFAWPPFGGDDGMGCSHCPVEEDDDHIHGGVWKHGMSDAVWIRVLAASGRVLP